MSRFARKGKKKMGAISTASLPDIVFMLLFFFMVVTVMREETVEVEVERPQATELDKLEKKHLIAYINIGVPFDQAKYGSEPRLQLDGKISQVGDIQEWVDRKRKNIVIEEERSKLTVSIKADEDVKMGLLSAVKQELREAGALKVNYSTNRKSKTE